MLRCRLLFRRAVEERASETLDPSEVGGLKRKRILSVSEKGSKGGVPATAVPIVCLVELRIHVTICSFRGFDWHGTRTSFCASHASRVRENLASFRT
ncbi:unnamed protein product [Victoria cruziana]